MDGLGPLSLVEPIEADCIEPQNSRLLVLRHRCDELSGRLQPAWIVGVEQHDRPVAAPADPAPDRKLRRVLYIGAYVDGFPAGRASVTRSGKLAVSLCLARDTLDVVGPGLPHAIGDVGLAAMIDDRAQIRIAQQQRERRFQMRRADQHVERKIAFDDRAERRDRAAAAAPSSRPGCPATSGGCFATADRAPGRCSTSRRVGRRHVDPADHAFDQSAARVRLREQPARFGHGLRRLYEHTAGDAVGLRERAIVLNEEIAIDRGQCGIRARVEPIVVAARRPPQMMVSIDDHDGVGASSSIRPSDLSSRHKSLGIGVCNMRKFSASSAGLRVPGITLATHGWCSGNCSAAAFNGTPMA